MALYSQICGYATDILFNQISMCVSLSLPLWHLTCEDGCGFSPPNVSIFTAEYILLSNGIEKIGIRFEMKQSRCLALREGMREWINPSEESPNLVMQWQNIWLTSWGLTKIDGLEIRSVHSHSITSMFPFRHSFRVSTGQTASQTWIALEFEND